jgi:hypothetical protein
MPPPGSSCLLVPSNERLCGTRFSHFSVGGPTPSAPIIGERPSNPQQATTTTRIAQHILYPCEAVDGVISELGGPQQEQEIQNCVPSTGSDDDDESSFYPIRCPTGEARRVPAVGMLRHNLQWLILAVAPFWKSRPDWEKQLHLAFASSYALSTWILVAPLLGAGTRGIPVQDAARIAAESTGSE